MVKCMNCGSEKLKIGLPIYVQMDIKHWHRITKKAFREKETLIEGAYWDRCSFICKECGFVWNTGLDQGRGESGYDLVSTVDVILVSDERTLIPTGIYIELPKGYELQVRSRSGISSKNSVINLMGIGTVDSDYRGEIKVSLQNLGHKNFRIKKGDRIAQAVITKLPEIELIEVEELENTEHEDDAEMQVRAIYKDNDIEIIKVIRGIKESNK